jgi:hypothetical protein
MVSCIWCTVNSSTKLCLDCTNLKKNIYDSPNDIKEFHSNFYLKINYRVENRSHDGYCSDHVYDDNKEPPSIDYEYEEFIYPAPIFLLESDFDTYGNLIKNNIRNLYEKSPEHNKIGWCEDCMTYYNNESIELIRPNNKSLPSIRYNWRIK